MPNELRIGMIGLDTSHAVEFTELLHNRKHPYHVSGGRITAAYPGGSADFELSIGRVDTYTARMRDHYGVRVVNSPEEVAEACDAILLEAVDGRVHLDIYRRIAPYGKPVFIDKPLAVCTEDAKTIAEIARTAGVRLMSCSALRYAQALEDVLAGRGDRIAGADCFGPMELQPTQPGLFWYGIHAAEMLYRLMGRGCWKVNAAVCDDHELIVGVWRDGRIGTIRGTRNGNRKFGALVHWADGSDYIDVYAHPKPFYASMLEAVMAMFQGNEPGIDLEETVEIVRFLEAANESRATGRSVEL